MTTVNTIPDNAIAQGAPSAALSGGVALVNPSAVDLVGVDGAVQHEGATMTTVNVNESDVQTAVADLLAHAGVAAQSRFGLLAAKSADKSATADVWLYLVTLASVGATGEQVRKAGSVLRASVARQLRVAAGFPPVKVKGSKESGAPDYSTASVYANIAAYCMDARRDNATTYDKAVYDATPDNGEIALDSASGVPLSVAAAKRVVKAYAALVDAQDAALFAPFVQQVNDTPAAALARITVERDALADENAALRAQLAMLQGARPAHEGLPVRGETATS